MSLILKGIDTPKKGEWLEVIIKPTKEVIVDTIRYRDNALLNTEYGSAIQIPKEHGRLIDADKLRRGFSRTESGYCGYWEFCDKPEDMQFLIDDEPTILEAEE